MDEEIRAYERFRRILPSAVDKPNQVPPLTREAVNRRLADAYEVVAEYLAAVDDLALSHGYLGALEKYGYPGWTYDDMEARSQLEAEQEAVKAEIKAKAAVVKELRDKHRNALRRIQMLREIRETLEPPTEEEAASEPP